MWIAPETELVACYARVLRALIVFARNREHGEVAFHDALTAALIPGVIDGIRRADAWVFAVGVHGLHEGAPCDKDLGAVGLQKHGAATNPLRWELRPRDMTSSLSPRAAFHNVD